MSADLTDESCPSADDLAGFVAGELDAEEVHVVAAHLDGCDSCRRSVSTLARVEHDECRDTLPADTEGEAGVVAGQRVGRFVLTRWLGAGAMGEVWAARDPELEREVALKLLRPHPELLSDRAAARLRREAQAMARLNHPNVVAVYELGDAGERVFCAMELVDGTTLRAWMGPRRSWREVLPIALAIGRGLAAAHAAGLVHRDVKPENVLLARDGRTLVTDFGLAKLAERLDDDTSGSLIGTPAYMAPEQLAGNPADAQTDQFAYCVVVYEMLFGTRPFTGDTVDELRAAIDAGPPQTSGRAPRRVMRALARGLAVDPRARWPSIDALLDELARAARRRGRWIAAGVAAAVAAAAVTVVAASRGTEPDSAAERAAADVRIARAWSPVHAAQLRAAFIATGSPVAEERAASLAGALDAYRRDWLAQRLDAWAATHLRGEQTLELLERRVGCYDRLAEQLGELVELLAHPTPVEVGRAPELAYRLEPIAACADTRRLTAVALPPSTPAGHELARGLRALEALQVLGRHAEALRRAEELVRAAESVRDPAALARARHDYGITLANTGRYADAETALRAALQDAAAARDHYLVATIWIRLISLVGLNLGRPAAAAELEPAARAAVAQAGDDPRQLGDLAFSLGAVAYGRGDIAAARHYFEDSRVRRVAFFGADHPFVASSEANLGSMELRLGELDEAQRVLDHARAITTRRLGDSHPLMSQIEANLAEIAHRRGDWSGAERHLRSTLRVELAVFANGHVELVKTRILIAEALREQRRYDAAAAELVAARQEVARAPASDLEAIKVGLAEANLAEVRGDWATAERAARDGAAAMRAAASASTADRAAAISDLARITAHRSPREALPIYDEACELHLSQPSRDESGDVATLTEVAHAALAAHRPAAALAWFDRMPKAAAQLGDLAAQLRAAR